LSCKTKIFDINAVKTFIQQRHLMLNAAEKSNCMIKLMVIEDYSEIGGRETSTAIEVAVLVVVVESE